MKIIVEESKRIINVLNSIIERKKYFEQKDLELRREGFYYEVDWKHFWDTYDEMKEQVNTIEWRTAPLMSATYLSTFLVKAVFLEAEYKRKEITSVKDAWNLVRDTYYFIHDLDLSYLIKQSHRQQLLYDFFTTTSTADRILFTSLIKKELQNKQNE